MKTKMNLRKKISLSCFSGCKRVQFTLIELLIVVAIIAILAGMLLPVLNNARQKANSMSCLSNVKQASLTLLVYVNDWNGWTPPIADNNSVMWFSVIYKMGLLKQSAAAWANGYADKNLSCPTSNMNPAFGSAYGLRCNGQATLRGFRFGKGITREVVTGNPIVWPTPSRMIFMGDTLRNGYVTNPETFERQQYRLDDAADGNPGTAGLPHFRHLKRANFAYGDGSARTIAPAELADEVTPRTLWTWFSQEKVRMGRCQ
ncbi:MAG: hypothetical protein BWY31_01586 [Lentisphaerae bacterium ADurb.Bin242]|nr:MAG: hypothetical protein BWY31_01586 [Lentisphaerae bacterium ADurb.Bin242]